MGFCVHTGIKKKMLDSPGLTLSSMFFQTLPKGGVKSIYPESRPVADLSIAAGYTYMYFLGWRSASGCRDVSGGAERGGAGRGGGW